MHYKVHRKRGKVKTIQASTLDEAEQIANQRYPNWTDIRIKEGSEHSYEKKENKI